MWEMKGGIWKGMSSKKKRQGSKLSLDRSIPMGTLESGIDVGQGITVGPGKLVKKNKHRALNKRRA